VISARKVQKDAPWHLLSFALQLGLNFKLHPCLQNIDVFIRFADARSGQCGSRLAKFKAGGGLLGTHRLSFKNLVFEVKLDKDKIVNKIVHVKSGLHADIPLGAHITLAHSFDGFWCDVDATHQLKPQPSVKLLKYFASEVDFGYVVDKKCIASQSHFEKLALTAKKDYTGLLATASASSKQTTERIAIVTELKTADREKMKTHMKTSRVKTLETVAANIRTRLTEVG
jgi:hypothetical protein